MANFNLPFGVYVSNENVLDVSRYVVKDISERDALIPGRAYDGLQTYVKDNSTLYILKDFSNSIWGIIPDLSTIAISDASKLNNYTDTFYGDLTVDGSIVISGNIIQDGSYYVTNVEEITSKNEFVTLREDSITALNDGSISGIRILKADGSANVILGASNDAVMRVGWEEEDLLAIATREDNPTNLGYAYWDDASSMFKTDVLFETVSRTIYVDASGNDTTGDGLDVSTAFATIGKALSTVKKTILDNVTVTIKVGVGTFDFGDSDNAVLSSISGSGILLIEGTLTLVESGFIISTAHANDPLKYSVSGGNTATWTSDQWQFYFLRKTTNYYPITHNTTTSLSTSISTTGFNTEIYQAQTILTFPTTVFNIRNNCSFNMSGLSIHCRGTLLFSSSVVKNSNIELRSCYFYNENEKGIKVETRLRITNTSFNLININVSYNFQNVFASLYIKRNTSYCVNMSAKLNDSDQIYDLILENPSTSSTACGLYLTGSYIMRNNSGKWNWKFINCGHAIIYTSENNLRRLRPVSNNFRYILDNTLYFLRKSQSTDGDYVTTGLSFLYESFYGAPTIRWFYDSMYEFVNLASGRNIQITGLIYPEVEFNRATNLLNNSSTNLIIGDASQNISISLDYTVKRSTALRKGKIDFIHDGTTLYQSPDSFICSSTNVDASALYFNSDVSGNLIRLNAIMDSGSDASLFYNVSRVMKTPLTI